MIQAIMLIALGFLAATLIGVLLAPSLWSRAVRLSKRRLESTLPLTLPEIEASQDQLRASYAVRLRRLETVLASAKQKAANQLVDNSRLQMQIAALKDQISDLELKLGERRNAATVLEQTITKRFPELDREISSVKKQLQDRAYELQDLNNKLSRRDDELAAAEKSAASYHDELTTLRSALEKSSGDRSGRRLRRASQWDLEDHKAEYDRLNLELSRLRQQLAHFQDRDAQQVGVIKGELQKLAELILASSQPKRTPPPVRPEVQGKRSGGQDSRRERPVPWLSDASPAPLTTRLKRAEPVAPEWTPAPQSPSLPAKNGPGTPQASGSASSPVLTILQEETILTSASKTGSGDAGARSKMLQEVVTGSKRADETQEAEPSSGRAMSPTAAPEGGSAASEAASTPNRASFAASSPGPASKKSPLEEPVASPRRLAPEEAIAAFESALAVEKAASPSGREAAGAAALPEKNAHDRGEYPGPEEKAILEEIAVLEAASALIDDQAPDEGAVLKDDRPALDRGPAAIATEAISLQEAVSLENVAGRPPEDAEEEVLAQETPVAGEDSASTDEAPEDRIVQEDASPPALIVEAAPVAERRDAHVESSLGDGATHASDDEETSFEAELAEGIDIDGAESDRELFKEGPQHSTLSERLRVAIVEEPLEPKENGANGSETIEEKVEAGPLPLAKSENANIEQAAPMRETASAAKQASFEAGSNNDEAPPQPFGGNGEAHGADEDFSFEMKLAEAIDIEIDKTGPQPSTLLERLRAAEAEK